MIRGGDIELTKGKYKAILQANKLAEEELKIQSRRNQLILDTTMDSYILADTKGQVLEVNQAYCDLIGYSRKALMSMEYRL